MECKKIENVISEFIENDLSPAMYKEVADHLNTCESCRELKERVEELMYLSAELEEEVPFFLKNRLYNIAEIEEVEPKNNLFLKWVAAMIGVFVLFLNLFYFTNILPPAHKTLHLLVSKVERIAVETGAFFEDLKGEPEPYLFSFNDNSKKNNMNDSHSEGFSEGG